MADLIFRNHPVIYTAVKMPWIRVLMGTLVMGILNEIIYSTFGDGHKIPKVFREQRRRAEWRNYRKLSFNYATRCLLDIAATAYFFVLTWGNWGWFDALYRNDGVASETMAGYVTVYLELQVARILFEMFFTVDVGFISMATGIFRGLHIIIPALLITMERATGQPPAVAYLSFMVQMDFVQIFADFKGSTLFRPLQALLHWRIVGTLWLVLRVTFPLYGLYSGRFGVFAGRGAFTLAIFIQFLLWVSLPYGQNQGNDGAPSHRRPPMNSREERQRRLEYYN